MKHLIAPSILSANFANLEEDILMLNKSEADLIHVDIMDGVFVPNISFGFPVVAAVKNFAKKPLDVHLMIVDPDRYLKQFKEVGANIITVHYEACTHLHRTIQAIKELGCKAGVALNPHTPVSFLQDIIQDLDLVLIMSVNPGFGGQKFIEHTYHKIHQLKKMADEVNPKLMIEIDGGVSIHNSLALLKAGANVLVAGNAVFNSTDQAHSIAELKNISPDFLNA
ncbi:MAG: ribulose-phosphate 3-epimerase [Bacteroidetes bacterium]|nr:ribulose-phosphate 3-epimerase [Bacteroidota bacterium]MBU1372553.1 ribulose-phosphate 3-epimerase [Bacteroidota bacterium]MBU1485038.1 ribulose-phosphate 3-epimerase [Bacteroidota bacterium]MBU1761518.1 ribulose-phosphate 3-epimerase [Bacteroidota bacterium]MBU2046223.1 ribulose-phosphate 3-epimerase [Bacteroidota bacterium]